MSISLKGRVIRQLSVDTEDNVEVEMIDGVKWHGFFCNPAEDTVLKSKDGVHFRASSFRLSAASTMLKGLIESDAKPEIIEVDCTSAVLAAFLSLINVPAPQFKLTEVGCSVFAGVLKLCDFFDCGTLTVHLTRDLELTRSSNPRLLFRYAAFVNDVPLARRALQHMPSPAVDGAWKELQDVLRGLRPSWQVEIMKKVFQPKGGVEAVNPTVECWFSVQWRSMAQTFQPEEEEMSADFKF